MGKHFSKFLLAAAVSAFAPLASAVGPVLTTTSFGEYSVTYDSSTSFNGISFNSGGGGGSVGFGWSFPTASLSSTGVPNSATTNLPEFTITANAGYTLSGAVTAQIGNLGYVTFDPAFPGGGGGSTAGVTFSALVSIDGGTPFAPTPVSFSATSSGPFTGNLAGTATVAVGGFTSVHFSGVQLLTSVSSVPGGLASVSTQPQNLVTIGFTALPVPEPETYLLFMAGLGLIGAIARRRGAAV
jgi:hypothetical protein